MNIEQRSADHRLPREFEHELMNLLALVVGHADILVSRAKDPELLSTAQTIRAAAEKAVALARGWPQSHRRCTPSNRLHG